VTGEAVIRKDWPDVAIELDTCQECGLRSEEAKEYFHRDHQKEQLRVKGSFSVPGHRFQAIGATLLWEGSHGTAWNGRGLRSLEKQRSSNSGLSSLIRRFAQSVTSPLLVASPLNSQARLKRVNLSFLLTSTTQTQNDCPF